MPPVPALRAGGLLVALAVAFGAGISVGEQSVSQTARVVDEAAAQISAEAETPVDDQQLRAAAVEGMLDSLNDRWASYQPATQPGAAEPGSYVGTGIWLRPDGPQVLIGAVVPRSPADLAGLRSGQQVLAVDRRLAADTSVAELTDLLRGAEGAVVTVTVAGDDGRPTEVPLVRALVRSALATVEPVPGVLLVRVPAITAGVADDLGRLLADSDPERIVLDLRGNGGGLLDEGVDLAGVFLGPGPVGVLLGRDDVRRELTSRRPQLTDAPLVVLVDGDTASSAEVIAAALQESGRAVVVGSRTFGKSAVQEPTVLSDGSGLRITVGRVLTPRGTEIDGIGVEPDVLIREGSPAAFAELRAVEVVDGVSAALAGEGRG
jgi:carboxyl-terminal processing protease